MPLFNFWHAVIDASSLTMTTLRRPPCSIAPSRLRLRAKRHRIDRPIPSPRFSRVAFQGLVRSICPVHCVEIKSAGSFRACRRRNVGAAAGLSSASSHVETDLSSANEQGMVRRQDI